MSNIQIFFVKNAFFSNIYTNFVPCMKTIYVNMEHFEDADSPQNLPPCAATVGFFDGVHLGHQHLIATMREQAARQGLETAVVTFDRHPRQVLNPDWQPQLLTSAVEKAVLLAQTGIDRLVILHFDRQMATLSAREFMQRILLKHLNVRLLYTGYDNRFGHERTESFADYVSYGHDMGMTVSQADELRADGLKVSSSAIRSYLAEGAVERAAQCLGHPYFLTGTVVSGQHIGTDIGFPTANLQPDEPLKLIPANGVYAAKVRLQNSLEQKHAMTNIGHRPTFNGQRLTLETHILHFTGDIYGQRMVVALIGRLRGEQKFDNEQALAEQLHHDAEAATQYLNYDPQENPFAL